MKKQEDAMMGAEEGRAADERKRAIDITGRHHRKLVSPERGHDDQLQITNVGRPSSGESGCI